MTQFHTFTQIGNRKQNSMPAFESAVGRHVLPIPGQSV